LAVSVLEYSPIAEILGAYPLANYAMNCSYVTAGCCSPRLSSPHHMLLA
jgi:hypothetical protein